MEQQRGWACRPHVTDPRFFSLSTSVQGLRPRPRPACTEIDAENAIANRNNCAQRPQSLGTLERTRESRTFHGEYIHCDFRYCIRLPNSHITKDRQQHGCSKDSKMLPPAFSWDYPRSVRLTFAIVDRGQKIQMWRRCGTMD